LRRLIKQFVKATRAIVGLEAAIVLIAFVIIAAAFSFMVINQGLYATERGKTVVQEGLRQASTPLTVDGTIFVHAASATSIDAIVIPLRAYGVKYVALGKNETAVTLKVAGDAWPNIYNGTASMTVGSSFDNLKANVTGGEAVLFIQNSNQDDALDSSEKGYLVIVLSADASARDHIVVEVRPEKAAPLTIDFYVPESLPTGWITVAG
jgi:flagellin FlaB